MAHYASIWYQFNSTTFLPKNWVSEILTENTTILKQPYNQEKLQVLKALHIKIK